MRVFLNSQGFSYDVHSLVKAFYPEEDVKVVTEGEASGEHIIVYVSSPDVKGSGTFSGTIRITAGDMPDRITKEAAYDELARPDIKSLLKRTLYECLSSLTGKSLPWGTMTGIRPTKVPMKLIREGKTDEQISEYMKSVYLCRDDRIELATRIAHRETEVIDSLPGNSFGLYIGIPFCPTTCMYCSFTSYPIASWKNRVGDYLSALKKEIDYFSGYYKGRPAHSIYIGGGTPTTLSADELTDLIGYIRERFDLTGLRELTAEAGRADSITEEKLAALKSAGADRISINPQTMNDRTLRIIGRRHSAEDVERAFRLARDAGFDNINMDIILGLPGEDESDVSYTLERIKEFHPDSLTVHSMAIKRAAAMHRFLTENEDISSINTPRMMEMTDECAKDCGLVPYYLYRQKNMAGNFENVGYCTPDKPGIYNIAIMEEISDIAAAGAGTISKRIFPEGRIERCDNVKDVALYIDRIDEMIDKKKKLFEGE